MSELRLDQEPDTSNCYVAKCKLCGAQWQVRTTDPGQLVSCNFCGAGCREYPAITLRWEGPDYSHGHLAGGSDYKNRYGRYR